jgi:hypothetical protein
MSVSPSRAEVRKSLRNNIDEVLYNDCSLKPIDEKKKKSRKLGIVSKNPKDSIFKVYGGKGKKFQNSSTFRLNIN